MINEQLNSKLTICSDYSFWVLNHIPQQQTGFSKNVARTMRPKDKKKLTSKNYSSTSSYFPFNVTTIGLPHNNHRVTDLCLESLTFSFISWVICFKCWSKNLKKRSSFLDFPLTPLFSFCTPHSFTLNVGNWISSQVSTSFQTTCICTKFSFP